MNSPISRRVMLRATVLAPAALASCSWLDAVANTDMTKVAVDISTISGAVTAVKNGIASISFIPASIRDKIIAAITDVQAMAASIATVASTTASQPFVVRIEDDLKAALDYGKGLLPSSASGVLSDALTVLSAVKVVIGLLPLIPLADDPRAVDAARLRLRAVAVQGAV